MRHGIIATAIIMATLAPALAEKLPVKKGQDYSAARAAMLKAGWKAVTEHDEPENVRCGFRTEECRTYPEAVACSGTGLALCAFDFSRKGHRLRITTTGESAPDLKVYGMEADPSDE